MQSLHGKRRAVPLPCLPFAGQGIYGWIHLACFHVTGFPETWMMEGDSNCQGAGTSFGGGSGGSP